MPQKIQRCQTIGVSYPFRNLPGSIAF
jgi:hypothetical protein